MMRHRIRTTRCLGAVALLSLFPSTGSAQGLVTLLAGYRNRAADNVRPAPMLSLGVTPLRWARVALGLELSWAQRRTQSDSAAIPGGGFPCFDPFGTLTTCASQRSVFGESVLQIGATFTVGPLRSRVAPFGEFAFGRYATSSRERQDVWDIAGVHLPNASTALASGRNGLYARVGLGIIVKPWSRGPGLTVSGRYRWAELGWRSEYPDHRSGTELMLGVRF